MPKVSIIVPVHNAGQYLTTLVDSICNQSFKDIEILLIDDGSTDGSRDILKDYEKKDNRIRVFFRKTTEFEHFGQKHSADLGIKEAKGTYIMLVDHDDELTPNSIEVLYLATENETIDVVQGRNWSIDTTSDNPSEIVYITPNLYPEKTIIKLQDQKYSVDEVFNHFINTPVALWCCLIKKEFLQTLELGDYIFNDASFIWRLKIFAKSFCYLPEYVYIDHMHNKTSTSSLIFTEKHFLDPCAVVRDMEKDLKMIEANSFFWTIYAYKSFNHLFYYYIAVAQQNSTFGEIYYQEFKKEMKRNLDISDFLIRDKKLYNFYQELIK